MTPLPEFAYRARFASRSAWPGAHRSHAPGAGQDIVGAVPIDRARDPRRLDLRAALRDPFGRWWARELRQRSELAVMLLVDRSASMRVSGDERALRFARALQRSAQRLGDAFGVAAFADDLPESLVAPPSRSRAAADAVLARLQLGGAFDGRSAAAIVAAADVTPRRAALVFLLSDFLFPLPWLDEALARLARHDVVPVWLRHPHVARRHGLVELRDAESGAARTLWLRPALARRWRDAERTHAAALRDCFARHDRVPLAIDGAFGADAVSEFFVARG